MTLQRTDAVHGGKHNKIGGDQQALGVCYYPEQWSETRWRADIAGMANLGLRYVRMGEFAWSRLEPRQGVFSADWLIQVMDLLDEHGLKGVIGTPTAAPPRWLVSKMPDMLFVDQLGQALRFGSRRHYCHSHPGYRAESARIVRRLAETLQGHPALAAWQVDNEYGCYDTVLSYSPAALLGFRAWLHAKYETIDALNRRWANAFWSMEYSDFDEIDFPVATPAQPSPTHRLDFWRYSSEQLVAYNKVQVAVLREVTPSVPICTNFIAMATNYDHFRIGEDLDFAAWDSYPLGYLGTRPAAVERKARYARIGDPDLQAFQHDLHRAIGHGRFWVMEQQPGPVNWAPYNNDPVAGAVRLWTWEAFAHGAEVVSYFRWRQAPFAQEQMHAGLMRPDDHPTPAVAEIRQVLREMGKSNQLTPPRPAECAIVCDYESAWAWSIQPQAKGFSHFEAAFAQYHQLRKLGLNVDVVSSHVRDLSAYELVFIPALFAWNEDLRHAMSQFKGHLVVGPRTGSKTSDFTIPNDLPPDLPASMLSVKVTRVASLAPHAPVAVAGGGTVHTWLDKIETNGEILAQTEDGWPLLVRQRKAFYLAGLLDPIAHRWVTRLLVNIAGMCAVELPPGLRLRTVGATTFAFNYGQHPCDLSSLGFSGPFGLDGQVLPTAGVATMPAEQPRQLHLRSANAAAV